MAGVTVMIIAVNSQVTVLPNNVTSVTWNILVNCHEGYLSMGICKDCKQKVAFEMSVKNEWCF